MGPASNDSNALDARVNSALQDFLERTDRGEDVDHEQFLAGHAEIADQLRSFIFDAADLARRATIDAIPSAEVSTNQSVSETIAPQSSAGLPSLPEVFGRYRLQRLLGRGAMGAVYLAQDTQLSRNVAIKVPIFGQDQSDELLQRFYIEARAAATLRNPHICPVYDVGEIAGWHYISMAYIEGHSLSDVIKANGAQPERQVLLLIRKLALALQEAHNQGIIHRDLKPGNVMLDARGEPVVMDFGLACQTREGAERITASGVILGSPAYMPPEQLEGNSTQITPAADQYALGVILYELLTGVLPFRGSISAVVSQIITKPAPSPRLLRPDLDPRVEALCLQMLSKTPEERLSSMKAVADRIVAILKEPHQVEASAAAKATIPILPAKAIPASKNESRSNPGEPTVAASSTKPVAAEQANAAAKVMVTDDSTESGTHHQKISTLCLLAAKLIRKHDYDQACRILSSIPAESRTDELTEMLEDAEEKSEESRLLLKDIELAIRNDQPKDLPALVRRFLQLKPGNKAMQTLAKELQQFGAERVIRTRRKRNHFLDPAGRVWNPVHVAGYLVGLAVLCVIVYMQTVAFQTANGLVIVEVHDPRVIVNFANDEITATSSGKKFHLKTTEKKTLQLEIDGVTVDASTQEISVAQNETKIISARLVDGHLDLLINSQKKSFAVPAKERTDKEIASKGTDVDGVNRTPRADEAQASEWIDLLATVDPAQASGSTMRWTKEGPVLTGKVISSAKVGWLVFVPPPKITGDYDLELDLLVAESDYLQVGLPLNETIVTASFGAQGTALHWIDGNDLNWGNNPPPHGNTEVRLEKGVRQRITASVRHEGENVTVETTLNGQVASRYSGLRSRLSTPKETGPRPDQMKLVALFRERSDNHRMEVHKNRVRLLKPHQPASPRTPTNEWTQLLNGKDLQGWTPMLSNKTGPEFNQETTGGWTLSNEELICETGAPGWLRLDKPYGDCEIKFECFLPDGSNSGLLVHFSGKGSIYGTGDCEIQLENDPSQKRPDQECGGVYGLIPPAKNLFRPGAWNNFAVRVRDGKLSVRLNEEVVVDVNLADHLKLRTLPPAGFFGLANHSGKAKGCRFRNISINDFSPGQSSTIATAPASPPHFKSTAEPATRPEAIILDVDFRKPDSGFDLGDYDHILAEHKNGEYRYLGKKVGYWFNNLHPAFWTLENRQVRDFAVEFDIRMVNKKKGYFTVEFGQSNDFTFSLWINESGQIKVTDRVENEIIPLTTPPNLRPIDQFNTIRMSVENKHIQLSVNGRPLTEKELADYAGGSFCLWLVPEEVPFDVRLQRFRIERLGQIAPLKFTQEVRRFKGHSDTVRAMAFLPDGQRAVSVGHNKAFKLWNVDTGELLFDFAGHTENVTSVSVSGDGKRALTGCDDMFVRLWDLESRSLLKTLKGHESMVVNVILSPDASTGLSSSTDGQIRTWDLKSGKSKLMPMTGGPTLAMSPNKSFIAIGQAEGPVFVGSTKGIASLIGHRPGDANAVCFTPDGTKLVTGSTDGTLRLWDLANGKEINQLVLETICANTLSVTSDSRFAIAGRRDHTVFAWDLQTGDKLHLVHADAPVTHRLALSPDNQYVLTGGGDKNWVATEDYDLRLWKLPSPPAPRQP